MDIGETLPSILASGDAGVNPVRVGERFDR
jgi:hypothetical protein